MPIRFYMSISQVLGFLIRLVEQGADGEPEGGGLGIQTGWGGLWEPKSGKGAGVSA